MGAVRPIVIAHRGACGYLPEHTLAAYAMAYAYGADYLEPDLVMTADGVLIARHDITLDETSNVAVRFPGRARADGHWYAADFSLAEIKQLEARERLEDRYRQDGGGFSIPTFEEILQLVAELNRATGRRVGVYPETKSPAWHRAAGLALEEPLLALLTRYGYRGASAPVFIQSFEPENLQRLRHDLGTELPLVQLIGDTAEEDAMTEPGGLAFIASYAQAVGPWKGRIESADGESTGGADWVRQVQGMGLQVHPWTFRDDDLPAAHATLLSEIQRFVKDYGVDGLFTDHTDRVMHCLRTLAETAVEP